jgi:hypothetical protein
VVRSTCFGARASLRGVTGDDHSAHIEPFSESIEVRCCPFPPTENRGHTNPSKREFWGKERFLLHSLFIHTHARIGTFRDLGKRRKRGIWDGPAVEILRHMYYFELFHALNDFWGVGHNNDQKNEKQTNEKAGALGRRKDGN